MSEELKPCPACGNHNVSHSTETTRIGTYHFVFCEACLLLSGPVRDSKEEAVAAWNALPRALEWTSEPKLGAWNWWGSEEERIPRYVYQDGTVAIAMQIDRVPYQVLGGQWCPIPEPREPE